ncbi:MAG: ribosome small subunit-dependent GTPase A [Myxococcota bacterium]
MDDLERLGFSAYFGAQLADDERARTARVTAEHRGAWEVQGSSFSVTARLAGRWRQEAEELALPAVGDWVVLRDAPRANEQPVIERVLERRTLFSRGAAGRETRAQAIAANVDLVFVVCGLDADFNVRRIERYLARVWASGARPVVVLSKADLCDDPAARLAEVLRHAPHVEVLVTSATERRGLEALTALIHEGATVAFVGSSGAGKSTLVNALAGAPLMETGAVRAHDGRGMHVTTHRQLVVLPSGGLLLDTPGMRELQLVDEEGLEQVFTELEELSRDCRFRDCQHDTEPGCAVRAAVEAGTLEAGRLEHWLQLGREAAAFELRHDVRRRRQAERVWGALSDEAAMVRRLKGRNH